MDIYEYELKYYEDNNMKAARGLVCAEDYAKAVTLLDEYYKFDYLTFLNMVEDEPVFEFNDDPFFARRFGLTVVDNGLDFDNKPEKEEEGEDK